MNVLIKKKNQVSMTKIPKIILIRWAYRGSNHKLLKAKNGFEVTANTQILLMSLKLLSFIFIEVSVWHLQNN